ncbi:MAG: Chromosome partitioning protein ParA [Alphaproteobacteria bacterium MarineAlpha9_Bin2]|nr:MAG: Chromosome partitioning protein ParA [Alphaproteobacteria bacterium MarineAlpha9_Bin1]PPR28786.1 MAG: Chromosome partitioning protein ParA [Alphaproteobacteria bacterium MarineAlpha9_Bin2]
MFNRSKKGRLIAIANQKGGVGKTTTAINLSTAMASVDKKVLLIDLDPQGNATTGLGIDVKNRNPGVYELFCESTAFKKVVRDTIIPGLSIIPSTQDLSAIELELVNMTDRAKRLLQYKDKLIYGYDYIFIDCPPSLGLLTVNALTAANSVLVPLQCEFFALEGLTQLLKTVDRVKGGFNKNLIMEGIVLTMYDRRNKLSSEVENDVRKHFGKGVFETKIPRNVRLSEAPSHGLPAILYDLQAPGSQAYIELVKEILGKR